MNRAKKPLNNLKRKKINKEIHSAQGINTPLPPPVESHLAKKRIMPQEGKKKLHRKVPSKRTTPGEVPPGMTSEQHTKVEGERWISLTERKNLAATQRLMHKLSKKKR